MGNCVFRGFTEVEDMVRVVTSSGGIMELFTPITAECITNEFPRHAIYRTPDLLSQPQPLLHNEELHAGNLYYLLPINISFTKPNDQNDVTSMNTPYRMSFDHQRVLKKTEPLEVLPRYTYKHNSSGVWKVKLVISPDQLAEILSQESTTETLIENVRTVAKCGNGVSSSANSDQLSVSSSWKGLW